MCGCGKSLKGGVALVIQGDGSWQHRGRRGREDRDFAASWREMTAWRSGRRRGGAEEGVLDGCRGAQGVQLRGQHEETEFQTRGAAYLDTAEVGERRPAGGLMGQEGVPGGEEGIGQELSEDFTEALRCGRSGKATAVG